MNRSWGVAATALWLLLAQPAPSVAAPAAVQTSIDAARQRIQQVTAAIAETNATFGPLYADIPQARTLEALQALMAERRPAIVQGRTRLEQLKTSIDALAPVQGADVEVQLANSFVTSGQDQMAAAVAEIGRLERLADAVDAGDADQINAILRELQAASATSLRGTALISRGQAALMPEGQSQAHLARATAEFSESVALMLDRAGGRIEAGPAAADLRAKAGQMQTEVDRARPALESEIQTGPTRAADRALMERAIPIQRQTIEILAGGPPMLLAIAEDIEAGRPLNARIVEVNGLLGQLGAATAALAAVAAQ